MDEWKDLTLNTLPKDIDHTKEPLEQYDLEESVYPPIWSKTKHHKWWEIIRKVSMGTKYRYRPIQKEEVSHECPERLNPKYYDKITDVITNAQDRIDWLVDKLKDIV